MGGEQQHTLMQRPEVTVMFKRADDQQQSITRAWGVLEQALGSLRGRRFYGVLDPESREYRACVELRSGDDPQMLELELGTLPGGRYVRERLYGEPPAVYALIAPAFERLAQRADSDCGRPSIEFYRRRDAIDLLQPVV
jgi:hypothetical protein